MIKMISKNDTRQKRHRKLRRKLSGTTQRPRLNVFRSNCNMHAQIIDDVTGKTLVAASTLTASVKAEAANGGNCAAAAVLGKTIGEMAVAQGINTVVFDRGGYLYHGRVKALAEAAREAGLEF